MIGVSNPCMFTILQYIPRLSRLVVTNPKDKYPLATLSTDPDLMYHSSAAKSSRSSVPLSSLELVDVSGSELPCGNTLLEENIKFTYRSANVHSLGTTVAYRKFGP